MSDLPNRIRELRKARGWSLDRLAAAVGCSKVQIADLELGKRRLSTYWMERIAPALGLGMADLLRDDQNPFRLSSAELRLIEVYRSGNDDDREMIARVAEAIRPYIPPPADEAAA